jgi:hypothetical protein
MQGLPRAYHHKIGLRYGHIRVSNPEKFFSQVSLQNALNTITDPDKVMPFGYSL